MGAPVAVINPQSASGATGRHWPALARLLGRVLGTFTPVFTERRGDGIRLARRAIDDGAELVVSVGGDGTHNEVVNGLFEGDGPRNPAAALAVVPAGTGGDLRRSLGLPKSPGQTIERLGDGRRRIDLGRLTYRAFDGSTGSRLFLNVSSCGVSGKVVEVVNRPGAKWLGGRAAFALASLRALSGYRDQRLRLRLDGAVPRETEVTTLAVANGQYFGGGMWVAPKAKLDDGLLDVTLWKGFSLSDFVLKAQRLYDGTHLTLPGVESFRATRVAAESDEPVLLELDGEQPGTLPAIWEVLPEALWLQGAGSAIIEA